MDLHAAVVLISWYVLCMEERKCLCRDSTPTSCTEGSNVQALSVDIACRCVLSVTQARYVTFRNGIWSENVVVFVKAR